MLIDEHFYTAEDLLRLAQSPAYAGKRLELSEGRLIVMSPAGWKHGSLGSLLDRLIGNFVDEHDLGITTAAETGYILRQAASADERDIVRAPDVGFIAKARIPADLPDGFVPFAPDLAVEVISPSDDIEEVHRKVAEYLRYGTRMVWLIYPRTESAAIYTPTTFEAIESAGALDGGAVLPGFRLPLRQLFRPAR